MGSRTREHEKTKTKDARKGTRTETEGNADEKNGRRLERDADEREYTLAVRTQPNPAVVSPRRALSRVRTGTRGCPSATMHPRGRRSRVHHTYDTPRHGRTLSMHTAHAHRLTRTLHRITPPPQVLDDPTLLLYMRNYIYTLVVASVFINQLIGPPLFKIAIRHSGEAFADRIGGARLVAVAALDLWLRRSAHFAVFRAAPWAGWRRSR